LCKGMVANPAESLRCAGVVLLVFGILGGIISPTGPLWAFIVGCMLVCCAEPGNEGLRRQASCAKCLSITGIVFSAIFLIACIGIGAWVMSASGIFCTNIDDFWGEACYRRLEQVDNFGHLPYLPDMFVPAKLNLTPYSPVLPTDQGRLMAECPSSVCPDWYLDDGYCDVVCNRPRCDYDGGDCLAGGEDSSCDLMRSSVATGCQWVQSLGVVLLIVPSFLYIIYIVAFSCVICRTDELLRTHPQPSHQGVVMITSSTPVLAQPTAPPVAIAVPINPPTAIAEVKGGLLYPA